MTKDEEILMLRKALAITKAQLIAANDNYFSLYNKYVREKSRANDLTNTLHEFIWE